MSLERKRVFKIIPLTHLIDESSDLNVKTMTETDVSSSQEVERLTDWQMVIETTCAELNLHKTLYLPL